MMKLLKLVLSSPDDSNSNKSNTVTTKMANGTSDGSCIDLEAALPDNEGGVEKGSVPTAAASQLLKRADSNQSIVSNTTAESSSRRDFAGLTHRRLFFTALILVIGAAASAAFLAVAITGAEETQQALFAQRAKDVGVAIKHAWADYEMFGLWVHDACIGPMEEGDGGDGIGICSYMRFRQSYEYIESVGTHFQAVQLLVNITNDQRPSYEERSRQYYEKNFPDANYIGLKGFVPNNETGGLKVVPMWEEPFYFALHHLAPVKGNEAAIDLNIYSHPKNKHMIDSAVSTWKPALSERGRLVQETEDHAYGIVLMHPGYPASTRTQDKPNALAQVVIRVPDLLARAAKDSPVSLDAFIFDSTDDEKTPVFMGGVGIEIRSDGGGVRLAPKPETNLTDLALSAPRFESLELLIADRKWTVAVVARDDTFQPNLVFLILGGCCIFAATVVLGVWFHAHMGRVKKLNEMKTKADAEKAAIIVDTARRQAVAEAQLNDFIAHEVRNPLSSAIAALSFISTSVDKPIDDEATCKLLREDIGVIDASLQFINDLMRNMLDMHRASSKKMKIDLCPIDVRRDIFQAVASILYLRDHKVVVLIDCPENLVVESDRLRLKQIVLNLSLNAAKFVEQGYIRLRADENYGSVRIIIEDSGPGIPAEKRDKLFAKFQDSLDILNQGTGIGLCLCKHLSDLMGCEIGLDESYDSGVPGCPGARMVLNLNTPPIHVDAGEGSEEHSESNEEAMSSKPQETAETDDFGTVSIAPVVANRKQLPEQLEVLFVDDDLVLRKMFSRSLKRVAPKWNVEEASNGETALHLAETKTYDLIFMDQWMASVQKQLTGIETVRALRAKGVESHVCGLSANDVESEFLEAGSNSFMFKPFPCSKEALSTELLRILDEHKYVGKTKTSENETKSTSTKHRGKAQTLVLQETRKMEIRHHC